MGEWEGVWVECGCEEGLALSYQVLSSDSFDSVTVKARRAEISPGHPGISSAADFAHIMEQSAAGGGGMQCGRGGGWRWVLRSGEGGWVGV